MTDTEMLDKLNDAAKNGLGWICRDSVLGRGLRLHQTSTPVGEVEELSDSRVRSTPREALQDFIERTT